MAFCSNCGTQLEAGAKFCGGCGTPAPAAATPAPVTPVAATPVPAPVAAAPAPSKSKVKRIVLILLIPIIAIAAGIAGVAGYLYIPGLIKTKVESHATEVFLQTTATVTANTTSLYAEKSATSTVLKTLKKNDVIIVTGLPANGWAPVKSGNISGWVLLNSITIKK